MLTITQSYLHVWKNPWAEKEIIHKGIDLNVPGNIILSPVNGTVVSSGFDPEGFGHHIWVKAGGFYSFCSHEKDSSKQKKYRSRRQNRD